MPNSFLPPLPRLIDYTQRPRNARRPSGVQIQYEGSLVPQPPSDFGAGAVTADMGGPIGIRNAYSDSLADQAGRYTLDPIPGTATNNLPGGPRTIDQGEIFRDTPQVKAQSPWFSAPFTQQYQDDLPYWQRNLPRR